MSSLGVPDAKTAPRGGARGGAIIPPNHEYALLALEAEAQLDADRLDVASDLVVLHDRPLDLPAHWREWLGTLEAQRFERCCLFVLATMPTTNVAVLNHENRWLEHRVDVFYRVIALPSVGVHVRYGVAIVGARGLEEPDVRQASPLSPIVHSPGLPVSFIVTRPCRITSRTDATCAESAMNSGAAMRSDSAHSISSKVLEGTVA
jgi:hypothetical protein